MVSKILALTALISLAIAKPMARDMKVRESRESVPSGFVKSGAADPNAVLKLRVALVQNNPEGLIEQLYAVSTPDSPTYGEHLTKEEVLLHLLVSECRAYTDVDLRRLRSSSLPPPRAPPLSMRGSRRPALPPRPSLPPGTG